MRFLIEFSRHNIPNTYLLQLQNSNIVTYLFNSRHEHELFLSILSLYFIFG